MDTEEQAGAADAGRQPPQPAAPAAQAAPAGSSAHHPPALLPVYDISRPPIKVVALDANAKLTRYSHLGHVHTTAQPVFGTFFGAAHNLVQQAVQDGTITSAALAAAQQADTEQATEEATAAAGDCPHPPSQPQLCKADGPEGWCAGLLWCGWRLLRARLSLRAVLHQHAHA